MALSCTSAHGRFSYWSRHYLDAETGAPTELAEVRFLCNADLAD